MTGATKQADAWFACIHMFFIDIPLHFNVIVQQASPLLQRLSGTEMTSCLRVCRVTYFIPTRRICNVFLQFHHIYPRG